MMKRQYGKINSQVIRNSESDMLSGSRLTILWNPMIMKIDVESSKSGGRGSGYDIEIDALGYLHPWSCAILAPQESTTQAFTDPWSVDSEQYGVRRVYRCSSPGKGGKPPANLRIIE
jgi:hypothetical protein